MRKVAEAIQAIQNALEVETDVTSGQVDLLDTVTHNASRQYALMCDLQEPAIEAADEMSAARSKWTQDTNDQLDTIEQLVDYYEHVAAEIEEWASELEVKTKRIRSAT